MLPTLRPSRAACSRKQGRQSRRRELLHGCASAGTYGYQHVAVAANFPVLLGWWSCCQLQEQGGIEESGRSAAVVAAPGGRRAETAGRPVTLCSSCSRASSPAGRLSTGTTTSTQRLLSPSRSYRVLLICCCCCWRPLPAAAATTRQLRLLLLHLEHQDKFGGL